MAEIAPLATLACGGAAGIVKPGWELSVLLTASGIAAQIEKRTNREVAQFLGGLIAAIQVDPFSICFQPDPGDPVLDQNDFNALINYSDFIAFGAANLRLRQWWIHMIWPLWCDCANGTHPPDAVLAPVPDVSINPGLPSGQVGANCWNATNIFPAQAGTATHLNTIEPQTSDIPGSYPTGNEPQTLPQPRPASITATVTAHGLTGVAANWAWDLQWLNADGTNASGGASIFSPSLNGNVTYTASTTLTGSEVGFRFLVTNTAPAQPAATFEATLTYYCAGQSPTQPIVPCCPPDPLLTGMLQQILGYVTLLQRQMAPFAYVPGALHSSLSGNGELSVQGLLGVKVTPHSIPPGAGVDTGDPDTLWLDSWINWGNPDGWTTREFLRSAPHVSLPNLAGQYTKIGYTLRPGLVVDVLELVREP